MDSNKATIVNGGATDVEIAAEENIVTLTQGPGADIVFTRTGVFSLLAFLQRFIKNGILQKPKSKPNPELTQAPSTAPGRCGTCDGSGINVDFVNKHRGEQVPIEDVLCSDCKGTGRAKGGE